MNKIIAFIFIVLLFSCHSISEPPAPVPYPSELINLTHDYKALAAKHSIKFTKSVKVGFTHINRGRVIGYCEFKNGSRRIYIDINFWNKASTVSKRSLMFHELTHCLCTRDHDFDDGTKYLSPKIETIFDHLNIFNWPKPGYHPDGCPLSIMHPVIIDDDCMFDHESEYLDEMFNRCIPY